MDLIAKYECFDTYQGHPGQATEIAEMIRAHQGHDACLEWPHKRNPAGYGLVRHSGKDWRVHRLAYKIVHGSVPEEPVILMHTCDNRPCFNPNHLKPGTRTDNADDRNRKGRTRAPHSIQHGTLSPNSKLTEGEVLEIRDLYRNGHLQVSLAARFKVSQHAISAITRRKSWKHLT